MASARARPLRVCSPCTISHILRPSAPAMCQDRSLSNKVIFEDMLGAPAFLPAALCRYRLSFVRLGLKTHDHISAHSSWSRFNLDHQWSSIKVILGRMTSRTFFLPKTSYRCENQCGWSHCVQLAKRQKLIRTLFLSGHHLTLNSRGLRSYSDVQLSVSSNTCLDGSRRKKHNGVRIVFWTLFQRSSFKSYS